MPDLNNVSLESAKDTDFELDIRITVPENQEIENPDTLSLWGLSCTVCTICGV